MQIISYSPADNKLFVQFNSGHTWEYSNITEDVYNEVLGLASEKQIKSLLRKLNTVGVYKGAGQ